ncbi:MAG: hypothetical protein H6713_35260 [Myxococcales bacterium]|nr:hypothetical protein [Myxococcales bacterium]
MLLQRPRGVGPILARVELDQLALAPAQRGRAGAVAVVQPLLRALEVAGRLAP